MTTGKRLLGKVAPFVTMVKGLAHPHRVAILYLLAHDELWMKDIVRDLGVAENLVAHHLKEMVNAGWVKKSRQGRHVTYALNKKAFHEIPKLLADTPFWREIVQVKKE